MNMMLKFKLEATSISPTVHDAGLIMLAADVADLRKLQKLVHPRFAETLTLTTTQPGERLQ